MSINKFFKNFILCGEINHHCLLCKESFQTVDDLEKHIRWENHRKNIKGLTPEPKFKKDGIFKIEDKYYCENCNLVIPTNAEASKHIRQDGHKENKTNPIAELQHTICKKESSFICIGDIKITNRQWNGVMDQINHCIFCNVDFNNYVQHTSLSSHMINLIQSRIFFKEGLYYRKMNEETCYCFLCKKAFPPQSTDEHWTEQLHVEMAAALKENRDTKAERAKLLELFDIDLENTVAKCKICTGYINLNYNFMMEHRKFHGLKETDKIEEAPVDVDEFMKSLLLEDKECIDKGKRRAEVAKFGRENNIKMVFPGSRGYCTICGVYIVAHIKNFTQHLRGKLHMAHLEARGLVQGEQPRIKLSYKTMKVKDFVKAVIHSRHVDSVWVNKHYCMDTYSFLLFRVVDESAHYKLIKCFACDVIYNHKKDSNHWKSEAHQEAFLNCEVITTMKSEFIREIRPNVYHCWVCNRLFPFWENLQRHLSTWEHSFIKDNKTPFYRYTEFGHDLPPSTAELNPSSVYAHIINLGMI